MTFPVITRETMTKARRVWWRKSIRKAELYDVLSQTIRQIDENQRHLRTRNLENFRQYDTGSVSSLEGGDYDKHIGDADRLRYNIAQSVVETAVALLSRNKIRPYVLTEAANYSAQKRAKGMMRFTDGQFAHHRQHKISQDIVRDAGIYGAGFEVVTSNGSDIVLERALPDEILWDSAEARYGAPRQIFRVRDVAPEVVFEMYRDAIPPGRLENAIESAGRFRGDSLYRDSVSGMVQVAEAWHLPSSKGAEDGRYCAALTTITLEDCPYTMPDLPVASFVWQPRGRGFGGRGVCEILAPLQGEIQFLVERMREITTLNVPIIVKGPGANFSTEKLQNIPFVVVEANDPDQIRIITTTAVPPEIPQQIGALYEKAFELTGIAQMTAQGEKPSGVTAAAAMRTLADVQSKRFEHIEANYKEFHIEVARRMYSVARQIDENGEGGVEIMAKTPDGSGLERIKWRDVSLDEDRYIMDVYPTNFFAKEPAAVLSQISDLAAIDEDLKGQALRLLGDYPDLAKYLKQRTAVEDYANRLVDQILEDGKEEPPEPIMGLEKVLQVVTARYLEARALGDDAISEDKRESLSRLMSTLEEAIKAQQAAMAPPAAPMPPMDPMAAMGQPPAMGPPPPGAPMGVM